MVEYTPTWVEIAVTLGIWALGLFVLTVLVRVALPIEMGEARSPLLEEGRPVMGFRRPKASGLERVRPPRRGR